MYTNPPNPPPNNFDIFKFRQVSGGNYCKLTLSGVWCLNMFLQPVVFWGYGGFPRLRFVIFSQCFKPGVALASFAGKCPRRGAPVDATGHGLWSEDDGYDGYDGDAEDADGEEMQVEEVRFVLMGRKKSQGQSQDLGWC